MKRIIEKNEVERYVQKSDDLVEARYSLPITAQKLIWYCSTKINEDATSFEPITITAKEMHYLTGNENPYEELKNTVDAIWNAEIVLKGKNGKYDVFKRWVTTLEYNHGEGSITMMFHSDLEKTLLKLKENRIRYKYETVRNIQNRYSIRFYDLFLNQKEDEQKKYELEFDLDELRKILAIDNKYSEYTDFKRYVIEPAISEISAEFIDLKYEKVLKGKKVVGIKFSYEI